MYNLFDKKDAIDLNNYIDNDEFKYKINESHYKPNPKMNIENYDNFKDFANDYMNRLIGDNLISQFNNDNIMKSPEEINGIVDKIYQKAFEISKSKLIKQGIIK